MEHNKSTDKIKILIVDDEPAARHGIKKALAREKYELQEAEDGIEALGVIRAFQPDVVLCDLNMPKMNGLELLQKIQSSDESPPLFIVITAYGSERVAVQAMKAGAYDYLSKPFEIEELRLVVQKAVEKITLERENLDLRRRLGELADKTIIGESAPIQRIKELIEKVAQTDVTVLLTGESGTGKELVANTIHSQSARADGPFVTMNCAAIPRDLVESELFGHEKGAFTGAVAQRPGKFEMAHGGTLFLDEIGDMGLETQAKILRVLEDKTFTRLGGKGTIQADVRLISATNKDLKKEIELGNFRQDLYYRIKVVEMKLPRLAERKEDIPLLANHFLQLHSKKHNKPLREIEPAALKALMAFDWPGNVRQLLHVIEQCVVLSGGPTIRLEDLPPEIDTVFNPPDFEMDVGSRSFKEEKERAVRVIEKRLVERALHSTNGNVTRAAALLDMKRQFLQHKIKQLGIDPLEFKIKKPR